MLVGQSGGDDLQVIHQSGGTLDVEDHLQCLAPRQKTVVPAQPLAAVSERLTCRVQRRRGVGEVLERCNGHVPIL